MFNTSIQRKVSQIDIKQINQDLIYSIHEYDDQAIIKSIEEGANVNADDALDIEGGLMEPPIIAAIVSKNFTALKILLKNGAKVTTTNKDGVPAFILAIGTSFEIVQEMLLYNADPNAYYGRSALSKAIVSLGSFPIIRYAVWSTPDIKRKLSDWYEQKGEFSPSDPSDPDGGVPYPEQTIPLRATYNGMLEIVSLLLSRGAQAWIPNDSNITVLDVLESPINYKKEFIRSNVKFLESTDNHILTFEVELYNRSNSAPPIKIIVDYDLRPVRNKVKTYIEQVTKYQGVDVKSLSEGLNSKISDHIHDKYLETTSKLEHKVQKIEEDTFSIIQKSKEKNYWKNKKTEIDANKLTKFFCERVDYRLRVSISASVVLASDVVTREKGTGENILSESLIIIGDHLSQFGGIVVKLIGKGIQVGIDRHYSQLHKATAKLFTFNKVDAVCDKTSIAVTDICTPLLLQPLTTEKEAKKMADKAVAFLLYLMSHEQLIKSNTENPLENQLIENFAKSELFSKYEREAEKKDQKLVVMEQKAFEKQQKIQQKALETQQKLQNKELDKKQKEEGKSSKLLTFNVPWKKKTPSPSETKKSNNSKTVDISDEQPFTQNLPPVQPPVYYGNLYPSLPSNGTNSTMTFSYNQQYRALPPINPEYTEPSAPPVEEETFKRNNGFSPY